MAKKAKTTIVTEAEVVAMLTTHQGGKQQNEFAVELGISPQMLTEVYKGRRKPGPQVLEYLSEAKGIELKGVWMYEMTEKGGKA